MKALFKIIRTLGVIVAIWFGISALNAVLGWVAPPYSGYELLVDQLVVGFVVFLRENLPAMSCDAGTWGPGLGAFLLALIIGHRVLSQWATRTNRHWSFGTSFCVFLVMPVLFAISFIIPGVLLQWEMLRQVPWIEIR